MRSKQKQKISNQVQSNLHFDDDEAQENLQTIETPSH